VKAIVIVLLIPFHIRKFVCSERWLSIAEPLSPKLSLNTERLSPFELQVVW